MVRCDRCGGRGHIPAYNHVQGGVCFQCWGSGVMTLRQPIPQRNIQHNILDDMKSRQDLELEAKYDAERKKILAGIKRKKEMAGAK
jgi:DnaJ-class molecular chaperone